MYKPIYLTYFECMKPRIIETAIGRFEVKIYKSKCFNEFLLRAKQISVIYDNEEYMVNDCMDRVILHTHKTINPYPNYEIVPQIPVTDKVEIKLQSMKASFSSKMPTLKYKIDKYLKHMQNCRQLIENIKNTN